MNYRKQIIYIVRECKRLVLKFNNDFNFQMRVTSGTITKMEGFCDLGIISFNEYKLLRNYIFQLRESLI